MEFIVPIILIILIFIIIYLYIKILKLEADSLSTMPAKTNTIQSQKVAFDNLLSNITEYEDKYHDWIMKLSSNAKSYDMILPDIINAKNKFNNNMNNVLSEKYGVDVVGRIMLATNDGTVYYDSMATNNNWNVVQVSSIGPNLNMKASVMTVQTKNNNIAFEKRLDFAKYKMEYDCVYRIGELGSNNGTVVFSIIVNPKVKSTMAATIAPTMAATMAP